MGKKKTYTVAEASSLTGLAENTIKDHCRKETILATKTGERRTAPWVIDGADLHAAMTDGRLGSPHPTRQKRMKKKKKTPKKRQAKFPPEVGDPNLSCAYCHREFQTRQALRNHVASCPTKEAHLNLYQTPLVLPCGCGFYTPHPGDMATHKQHCDGKPENGKPAFPAPPPPLPKQQPLPFDSAGLPCRMRERLVRSVYRSCILAALNEQAPSFDAVGIADVVDTVETMVDDVLGKAD